MRTLESHTEKAPAVRAAHWCQEEAPSSVLVGVERDYWKEPYSWRVVSFDLHSARDRSYIKPIGAERVTGVEVIMFARRRIFVVPAIQPQTLFELTEIGREKVAA